jgi:hypothetical protein
VAEDAHQISCRIHGTSPPTFTCRHVAGGVACGHHSAVGEEVWLDAWCDACDEQQRAAGGWNDELALAVGVPLCTHCGDEARVRNAHVPPLARGRAARMTDAEMDALGAGAIEQLNRTQAAAVARWGFGELPRWDFDAAARTIAFSDERARRLVADVRMVGSYATASSSFQWAWVLYPPHDPLVEGISDLRGFGEARGIARLTTSYFDCGVGEGWGMTAIAAYLLGCDGVFRAPFGEVDWFMLLRDFRRLV